MVGYQAFQMQNFSTFKYLLPLEGGLTGDAADAINKNFNRST